MYYIRERYCIVRSHDYLLNYDYEILQHAPYVPLVVITPNTNSAIHEIDN